MTQSFLFCCFFLRLSFFHNKFHDCLSCLPLILSHFTLLSHPTQIPSHLTPANQVKTVDNNHFYLF